MEKNRKGETVKEKNVDVDELCEFQHGFNKGQSCLTNMLKAIDNWRKYLICIRRIWGKIMENHLVHY